MLNLGKHEKMAIIEGFRGLSPISNFRRVKRPRLIYLLSIKLSLGRISSRVLGGAYVKPGKNLKK